MQQQQAQQNPVPATSTTLPIQPLVPTPGRSARRSGSVPPQFFFTHFQLYVKNGCKVQHRYIRCAECGVNLREFVWCTEHAEHACANHSAVIQHAPIYKGTICENCMEFVTEYDSDDYE